jgi:presenilin-like A22 family membrane protease
MAKVAFLTIQKHGRYLNTILLVSRSYHQCGQSAHFFVFPVFETLQLSTPVNKHTQKNAKKSILYLILYITSTAFLLVNKLQKTFLQIYRVKIVYTFSKNNHIFVCNNNRSKNNMMY